MGIRRESFGWVHIAHDGIQKINVLIAGSMSFQVPSTFMSLPTRQLQNLSIGGGMNPSTRSQAQRQRRQRERAERQRAAQQQAAEAAQQDEYIESHTGLRYDARQLTLASREAVARGLQSESFRVDVSKKHGLQEGYSYYGFQVRGGAASVRIDSHVGHPRRRIRCSCEEFHRNEDTAVCAHIYVSHAK